MVLCKAVLQGQQAGSDRHAPVSMRLEVCRELAGHPTLSKMLSNHAKCTMNIVT